MITSFQLKKKVRRRLIAPDHNIVSNHNYSVKYKAMSWMTGIIHEPMTFILDTCRLYHTGKLWKKHSAITVNVRSSIKTIILVSFKVPGKKTLRIWPHSLGNCLLLDPLPTGISDALRGGKYKPHPGVEGNSFNFLMNLCRYTCNSYWSHCKFFFKLFKQF